MLQQAMQGNPMDQNQEPRKISYYLKNSETPVLAEGSGTTQCPGGNNSFAGNARWRHTNDSMNVLYLDWHVGSFSKKNLKRPYDPIPNWE